MIDSNCDNHFTKKMRNWVNRVGNIQHVKLDDPSLYEWE